MSREQKHASGHKTAKERVSVLLCSNATGDFLLKPVVIHKFLNPRAFKNIDRNKLPVI